MMTLYNLPEYDTPEEFFVSLAEVSGKFKKRGLPDTEKAAKQLIEDWNKGKIRYHTVPPEVESAHISASIVTQDAAEFDLDSFREMEAENLEEFQESAPKRRHGQAEPTVLDPSEPVMALLDDADAEGKMEEDKDDLVDENVKVIAEKKRKIDRGESKRSSAKEKKKEETLMQLEGNQKLNLHNKLELKKLKKKQARNSRHASALAGVLENFSLGDKDDKDDAYDFQTDFTD